MKHEVDLSHLLKVRSWGEDNIRYIGRLPEERTIFFSTAAKTSGHCLETLYRSVLEAAAASYSIAYVPGSEAADTIEKAVYDYGKGRLYAFVPKGFLTLSRALMSRALVTGGGVLSLSEDNDFFSFERLLAVRHAAGLLAKATVIADENLRGIPTWVEQVLEEGREVFLLKNALKGRGGRALALDGCPYGETFADFLLSPRYLTYPSDTGAYGLKENTFDIMDLHYGKC